MAIELESFQKIVGKYSTLSFNMISMFKWKRLFLVQVYWLYVLRLLFFMSLYILCFAFYRITCIRGAHCIFSPLQEINANKKDLFKLYNCETCHHIRVKPLQMSIHLFIVIIVTSNEIARSDNKHFVLLVDCNCTYFKIYGKSSLNGYFCLQTHLCWRFHLKSFAKFADIAKAHITCWLKGKWNLRAKIVYKMFYFSHKLDAQQNYSFKFGNRTSSDLFSYGNNKLIENLRISIEVVAKKFHLNRW